MPEAFVLQTLLCDPGTVRAVGSVFTGISADLVATMEGYERVAVLVERVAA